MTQLDLFNPKAKKIPLKKVIYAFLCNHKGEGFLEYELAEALKTAPYSHYAMPSTVSRRARELASGLTPLIQRRERKDTNFVEFYVNA